MGLREEMVSVGLCVEVEVEGRCGCLVTLQSRAELIQGASTALLVLTTVMGGGPPPIPSPPFPRHLFIDKCWSRRDKCLLMDK